MYLLFQDGLRCGGCMGNAAPALVATCLCKHLPCCRAKFFFLLVLFCGGIRTMEDRKDTRSGLQRKQSPSMRKRKTFQVRQ